MNITTKFNLKEAVITIVKNRISGFKVVGIDIKVNESNIIDILYTLEYGDEKYVEYEYNIFSTIGEAEVFFDRYEINKK